MTSTRREAGRGAERDDGPPHFEESIEDLYEHAPCGYLSTRLDGTIIKVNQTFLARTGHDRDEMLAGVRFPDLLTVVGRVFHQTHVVPLLAVEGSVREIAAEIVRPDRTPLPVLFNAARRDVPTDNGPVELIRFTVLDATDRRGYERELLDARRRAEEALATVRRLEGLLPICAWCRRIRSDDGYWMQLEQYLTDAGAEITHGICQDCADRQ